VDVGRQPARLVERADANEADRVAGPGVVLQTATRQRGQRAIRWPAPLADGVSTSSGAPLSSSTRSDSISALSANDAPLSRWHQVQWQQCTKSGRLARRKRTARHVHPPSSGRSAGERHGGRLWRERRHCGAARSPPK
jgi:hypothetical protein